jgi:hypothetical protein
MELEMKDFDLATAIDNERKIKQVLLNLRRSSRSSDRWGPRRKGRRHRARLGPVAEVHRAAWRGDHGSRSSHRYVDQRGFAADCLLPL